MRTSMLLSSAICFLLFAVLSFAQQRIPAGTILPLELNSTVKSNKSKTGQKITAHIMQDVPLPGSRRIRAGAKVIGVVVRARPATATQKAEVTIRFDRVVVGKKEFPVTTNLRALASMLDVSQAQVPEMGPDRGTPSYWWTTNQIGGQVNYHGNGLITEGNDVVGHSTDGGVLARISSSPRAHCRDGFTGDDQLQALWLFSSDACGVYDYGDVVLKHAGRTDPRGEIMLQAARGNVNLRSGSGLLLRVNP